ncbi:MAG: UDP-glucose 4-epimerase GalE [Mogibacterium sp.]|nr:UDP-glucose 4-epimerase GalE [Mogibacterium sp.]
MKTLLTGGAGYIGSHTAVAMLDAGHEVAVVDNYVNSSAEAIARVEKITGKKVALYEADVADKPRMMEILKAEMPDCIIHFAGLKAVGESVAMPVEYYRNNIDTTLTLLECMRELGLTNIVFSSSATVYGEDNVPPFTEDAPKGMCTNPYGWTKWMQEQMLTDAAKASAAECEKLKAAGKTAGKDEWKSPLSVVLLRYFNPVGAHESGLIGEDPQGIPNNLMPFISQVAVGRRDHLTVFGDDYDTPDGTCRRDYIHVMDLAEGHVKAAEYILGKRSEAEEESGKPLGGTEVFNLGTGSPYSVLEMVAAFGRACGHAVAYEVGARRAGDVQDSWADAEKARAVLGWQASRGIDEICRDAWNWQSHNPHGYKE